VYQYNRLEQAVVTITRRIISNHDSVLVSMEHRYCMTIELERCFKGDF